MIFPLLNGVFSFFRAPVAWTLFFINLLVYIFTSANADILQIKIEKVLKDDLFSVTQGLLFANFIDDHHGRYPASLQHLAESSLNSPELEHRRLLGMMAMRDTSFLENANKLISKGDRVAFGWWKKKFSEVQALREEHPSYQMGVMQNVQGFKQFLTYQFMHSGVSHFAGNMILFLIFGTSLEVVVGGLGLLVTYLASGIFAALVFLLVSGSSAAPLVGASGAISGIVALFCILFWQRNVRYIFFLFIPKRGFSGMVYLPAWLTLVLWLLSDVAGHWATPAELGGVAYSAHLGGQFCGILIGLVILSLRYWRGHPYLAQNLLIDTKPAFTRM